MKRFAAAKRGRWLRTAPLLIALGLSAAAAQAQTPRFFILIEGTPLDFSGLKEEETDAVKSFKTDGKNPYNGNAEAIAKGNDLFQTACSGCHGHVAEGKLGPGLNDSYWTYKQAARDPGLFSAIYGGLGGSMGPLRGRITQDEILHIMAWLRSLNPKTAGTTASK